MEAINPLLIITALLALIVVLLAVTVFFAIKNEVGELQQKREADASLHE